LAHLAGHARAALWPFCDGKAGTDLVFEHDSKPGAPMCGVSLCRRFVSARKRAELPPLRLHDLRHTFGTQAIRVFKIHEVQQMTGHRRITTTERHLALRARSRRRRQADRAWGSGAPLTEDPSVRASSSLLLQHAA
jgi:integrase